MSEPTTVLLLGAGRPVRSALLESVPVLQGAGARVYLGLMRPSGPEVSGVGLDGVRVLQASYGPPGTTRFSLPWLVALPARLSGRLIARRADTSWRLWNAARRDSWLREHAAEASVIVALDPSAAWTVWQLARRHPNAAAIHGLAAAVAHVTSAGELGSAPAASPGAGPA
jgi:hypothetical protein